MSGVVVPLPNFNANAAELLPPIWLDRITGWKPRDTYALMKIEPMEWLIEGWIPRRIAGVIVAEGGTGKTTLVLHAMCCIATGRPCLGCAVEPGTCVLLSLDDPQDDIDAAFASILHASDYAPHEIELIRRRVRLISLRALAGCKQFAMLERGSLAPTGVEGQLVDALKPIDDLRLVSLDTLRMFSGSDSKDERAMTIATQALTFMADNLRCAVMSAHHTGKGQSRDKVEDQYVASGSSAISDNLRVVLRLRKLTMEEAQSEFDGWQPPQPGARLFKLVSTRGSIRMPEPDPLLIERDGFRWRHIDATAIPKCEQGIKREKHIDILMRLMQNGMPYNELRYAFYDALGDKPPDTKKKAFGRSMAIAKENGICDVAQGIVILLCRGGT